MKRFFAKNQKNCLPSKTASGNRRINLHVWNSHSQQGRPKPVPLQKQISPKGKQTIQDVIDHFMKNPYGKSRCSQDRLKNQAYQGNYKDDLSTLKNDSITVESKNSRRGHSNQRRTEQRPGSESPRDTRHQHAQFRSHNRRFCATKEAREARECALPDDGRFEEN